METRVTTMTLVSVGHVQAGECGAMNDWLATAPHATSAAPPFSADRQA